MAQVKITPALIIGGENAKLTYISQTEQEYKIQVDGCGSELYLIIDSTSSSGNYTLEPLRGKNAFSPNGKIVTFAAGGVNAVKLLAGDIRTVDGTGLVKIVSSDNSKLKLAAFSSINVKNN